MSNTSLRFDVITLFPEILENYTDTGVVGRGFKNDLAEINLVNPRQFTNDIHQTVDDKPYGGSAGMVLKYDCLAKSFDLIESQRKHGFKVYMTPRGRKLNQRLVEDLSKKDHLILLCGRYEGVDERLIEDYIDLECSIGDYILSGGELAACVLIDSVMRQRPGVIKDESKNDESFATGLLDTPHYTRPATIRNKSVPDILQSGDHQAILRYRKKQALGETWRRKPALFAEYSMTKEDLVLLNEYLAENRFLK